MPNYAFIPARIDSSRFYRKVLHQIKGKTMLQRVYEGASSQKLDEIFITTCDEEVAEHAKSLGAAVIMTSKSHERCLDRVAEAYSKLPFKSKDDIILCIQGDEPLIDTSFVDFFLENHIQQKYQFSVAAVNIQNYEEFHDPDIVKIIWNQSKKMVYTSRSAIPYLKEFNKKFAWKIFGMFGFKPEGLSLFNSLEPSFLEIIEQCDTNRICGSSEIEQYVVPYLTEKIYQAVDNKSNLNRVIEILDKQL